MTITINPPLLRTIGKYDPIIGINYLSKRARSLIEMVSQKDIECDNLISKYPSEFWQESYMYDYYNLALTSLVDEMTCDVINLREYFYVNSMNQHQELCGQTDKHENCPLNQYIDSIVFTIYINEVLKKWPSDLRHHLLASIELFVNHNFANISIRFIGPIDKENLTYEEQQLLRLIMVPQEVKEKFKLLIETEDFLLRKEFLAEYNSAQANDAYRYRFSSLWYDGANIVDMPGSEKLWVIYTINFDEFVQGCLSLFECHERGMSSKIIKETKRGGELLVYDVVADKATTITDQPYIAVSHSWGYFKKGWINAPRKRALHRWPELNIDHGNWDEICKSIRKVQGRFFWYDAVAIDQEEISLKRQDVAKQANIFKNADKVLVILRGGDRNYRAEIYKKIADGNMTIDTDQLLIILKNERWFVSKWTTQEILLPQTREHIVMCNGEIICNTYQLIGGIKNIFDKQNVLSSQIRKESVALYHKLYPAHNLTDLMMEVVSGDIDHLCQPGVCINAEEIGIELCGKEVIPVAVQLRRLFAVTGENKWINWDRSFSTQNCCWPESMTTEWQINAATCLSVASIPYIITAHGLHVIGPLITFSQPGDTNTIKPKTMWIWLGRYRDLKINDNNLKELIMEIQISENGLHNNGISTCYSTLHEWYWMRGIVLSIGTDSMY